MRILHISDLHISAKTENDSRTLVSAMLKDAEAHASDRPFDVAIFSGDLADHGKTSEYDLAQEILLTPLMEGLDLPPGKIFIAPGNHDVDRDGIKQMFEIGLINGLKGPEDVGRLLGDAEELAEATARLGTWAAFVKSAGHVGLGEASRPLAGASRIDVDGKTVGLAVLNSAWRCASSKDKGRLLVGGAQAATALQEVSDCDVRLALIHHPLDWLQSFEADQIRIEFESQGFIVLSGHEHSPDPSAHTSPRGEAIYLQAGCLYSHMEYPNAYFILDIDSADREIAVKIRRWSSKTRMFDAATEDAPGGEHSFGLPGGGGFTDLGHPRFSVVKRTIAAAAGELRVLPEDLSTAEQQPRSVEDILIEPRFLSVPFKEAQAVATLADGVGKHEVDAIADLLEQNVLVVSGEPQSGVSSSLFWLLSSAYDLNASKMPAYMKLPDSRLGTSRQSVTLAKAASAFGYHSADGADPDLMLAVDDVDPGATNKFKRLIKFVKENPRHRIILGCSSTETAEVSAALEDAGVRHSKAYLAPFGKSQLRRLATTVSKGADADLDQIYGLILTQSLPQTPFTMLALIAVVTDQLADPDDLNQSSLLDAFVNLLLGSSEFADAEKLGMNYRKRVALLGDLARALFERPEHSMPILEVEAMFVQFFKDRALQIPAARVLNSLIARQVLASDGENIGFRHPALLQLFLGKWMLEKDSHKAEMLADPPKNAEAIVHATALERSDADLLRKIGTFARETIAGVSGRLPRAEVDEILANFKTVDPWSGERLDSTLAALPERRPPEELDRELDRWSEAFDIGSDKFNKAGLSTARELEKATMLLSDVLRNSDLVDDPALKQELFELATEGWILLIGLATAEDHSEGPVRALMEEIIEELLDDDEVEYKEFLSQAMLLVMTLVIGAVAQNKLSSKSLAATIESSFDSPEFTESAAATWIAVWCEAELDLTEWPRRLDSLLQRLPRDTFVRNAAVGIAVAKYRGMSDDVVASALLDVLAPQLVAEPDQRKRAAAIAAVKERLKKSRLVFQGGLSVKEALGAPALTSGSS